MIWANFLHIYQPPTQKPEIVRKVTKESYRKIVQELSRTKRARVTLNISGVLTELLARYDGSDVIRDLKDLALKGQIEFTGSAKYHPLLPKLPESEAIHQIKLNDETNRKYFGKAWQPKGFFPPEMGFSKEVAKIASDLGFEWIIADEFSYPRELGAVDYSKIHQIRGLPLKIYFRERATSFKILSAQLGTGKLLLEDLGSRIKENKYLLTAMDGETFGHHRLGLEQLLFDLYRSPQIQAEKISDLPKFFTEVSTIDPEPSTWALTRSDREKQTPFSRWDDVGNPIHKMQWQLTDLAIRTAGRSSGTARVALDRALHSDQYWWAGAKPWWSIEYIERGAKELVGAIKLSSNVSKEIVDEAERLYLAIISTAFDWQRDGIVDELAKSEDEEVVQRINFAAPDLARAEFDRMIKNLRTQMLAAATHQEYERAAQFRNRIAELEAEKAKLPK